MMRPGPSISEKWLLLFGFIIVAVLMLMVFARIFPPEAGCTSEGCKEAREWVAILLTFFVILGGLYQFMQAQRWKRAEWVASETKVFLSDPEVKNALHMLDWNGRILPTHGNVNMREDTFVFHFEMLMSALYSSSTLPMRPGTNQPRKYTAEELVMRDCFDRMLDGLERFQVFVESGLVSTSELKPYLSYWIRLIGDDKDNPRKPRRIVRRLWVYIDEYGYQGVQKLCLAFGHDIRPNSDDRERADERGDRPPSAPKSVEPELSDEQAGG